MLQSLGTRSKAGRSRKEVRGLGVFQQGQTIFSVHPWLVRIGPKSYNSGPLPLLPFRWFARATSWMARKWSRKLLEPRLSWNVRLGSASYRGLSSSNRVLGCMILNTNKQHLLPWSGILP